MMAVLFRFSLLALLATCLNAQQIVNGQIYTPGIAIVDAPQPNTPLGGGTPTLSSKFVRLLTDQRLPSGRSRRNL
jgi:hypothetical protein